MMKLMTIASVSTTGLPRAFPIPRPKGYDSQEEDWASAVVWYVLRPAVLRGYSQPHYEFVRELFTRYRIEP